MRGVFTDASSVIGVFFMDAVIGEQLRAIVAAAAGRTLDPADAGDFAGVHGLDLFDLSEIVVAIEETFGFNIPDGDVSSLSSMASCTAYVEQRMAEIRSWIRSE